MSNSGLRFKRPTETYDNICADLTNTKFNIPLIVSLSGANPGLTHLPFPAALGGLEPVTLTFGRLLP